MTKTIWKLYNNNMISIEVADELLDAWYGLNTYKYR